MLRSIILFVVCIIVGCGDQYQSQITDPCEGKCSEDTLCHFDGKCYPKDPCHGSCTSEEMCTVDGKCISNKCVPQCITKDHTFVCGPDPVCNVSCGECAPTQSCSSDQTRCIDGFETFNLTIKTDIGLTEDPGSLYYAARKLMGEDFGRNPLTGLFLPQDITYYKKTLYPKVVKDVVLLDTIRKVVNFNNIIIQYFNKGLVKNINVTHVYAEVVECTSMTHTLYNTNVFISGPGIVEENDPNSLKLTKLPDISSNFAYNQEISIDTETQSGLNGYMNNGRFSMILTSTLDYDSDVSRALPSARSGNINVVFDLVIEVYPFY